MGSTDKRPEVPQGGQNRGNKHFDKYWVASLTQASSPDSPPHQLWPDPPMQEDREKQSLYIFFVILFFETNRSPFSRPFLFTETVTWNKIHISLLTLKFFVDVQIV